MSVVYIDGWDWGTAFGDRWPESSFGPYSSASMPSGGRYGSGSYLHTIINEPSFTGGAGAGPAWIRRTFPASHSSAVFGAAIRYFTGSAKGLPIIGLMSGGGYVCEIRVDSNNCLYLTCNGTQIGSTAAQGGPGQLLNSNWVYLEFKVVFSATVGTAELRVNGTTVIGAVTGTNTAQGGTSFNQILLGQTGGNGFNNNAYYQETDFDDMYILDTAGGANNDFLGERLCLVQPLIAAGTYQQWTQTGGTTNQPWTAVATNDGDTSYIAANTVGKKETFTVTALPAAVIGVNAVQFCPIAKKDAGGFRHIAALIRSSTTDLTVGDFNLSTAYTGVSGTQAIQETDPATSAPWTTTGFNNAEFGVQVTS